MFDLSGKVALVTGGGTGLGQVVCEALAEAGAKVSCTDLQEDWAKETVQILESKGGEAMALRADVTKQENVKAMVVLETDARGKLSEAEIIEYCEGKLAHYKIPKVVEFMGEVPKTDVGKISRRELREEEV
mgnify:CR=1 FL=1